MIDRELVESKLDRVRQYLRELEAYPKMDFDAYLKNNEHYRTVERLLQLIVDAAIEINAHLLIELGQASPEDSYTSFTRLTTVGALDAAFAERIAASTGLRNRLVHDYADVNALTVFESIPDALRDYTEYASRIFTFLDQQPSGPVQK